ncbi:MAG TPA: DUF58 domain-containing protein [Polyangia bacterium]|nr:DUF58 domain-containing protein [Polyangia bacterium]
MRRLPPTREGWWFLIATAVVGAVALDAGINLFFLTFGMMVCLLLAGVLLAGLGLSGLRVRRIPPPVIHAGTPYLMGIALENHKRRLPSFSIEVEDLVDEHPIDKRCYFLKLPAGRTQETSYRHRLPRRGRHRLSGFRLATKFPFGLMQRARLMVDPAEVVVYPALAPLPPAVLRGLPSPMAPARRRSPNRQGELAGLRAFREGDDPRDIHWRSSARRGKPLVREHEDDEGQRARIVFDNRGATHPAVDDPAFELAVSRAAALCVELVRRGLAVGLVTQGGELPAAAGPRQLARLLQRLAFIQPEAGGGPLRVRGGATVYVGPDGELELAGPGAAGAGAGRGTSGGAAH